MELTRDQVGLDSHCACPEVLPGGHSKGDAGEGNAEEPPTETPFGVKPYLNEAQPEGSFPPLMPMTVADGDEASHPGFPRTVGDLLSARPALNFGLLPLRRLARLVSERHGSDVTRMSRELRLGTEQRRALGAPVVARHAARADPASW